MRRSGPPSGEFVRLLSSAAFIYDDFSCGGFQPIYDYDCVSISDSTSVASWDSRSYCHTWTDPLEAGGQYYYRARWYFPEGGLFGERDPLGYHDSLNFYQALMNSPFNWNDPWGANVVPEPPAPKPAVPYADSEAVPEAPPTSPVDPIRNMKRRTPGMWPAGMEQAGMPSGIQRLQMRELINGYERLQGVDLADEFVVGFLLDKAEEHHGSSGVSFEGMSVNGALGAHLGVNLQIFYNGGGSYSLGLYGLESLRTPWRLMRGKIVKYDDKWQKVSGPTGVLGIDAGVSLAVNLAVAESSASNIPREWKGYFDTWSFSAVVPIEGVPVPVAGSYFRSDVFQGVELGGSIGVPYGAAYTRPYFHLFKQWRVNREEVAALYRIISHRVRRQFF